MSETKYVHPIKRVRCALKETSELSGLRKYASSKGFAEWIGRSSSLIRNVECGITVKWDRLAKLIESKTQVSSEWLLSSPATTDPILDVNGREWNAVESLDWYPGGRWEPNFLKLFSTGPQSVPKVVLKMVQVKLDLELSEGKRKFMTGILSLFRDSDVYDSEEFWNATADALRGEAQFMVTETCSSTDRKQKQIDLDEHLDQLLLIRLAVSVMKTARRSHEGV